MTERDRINPVATIAVACLATVTLMLDISVINTALSKIAHGLDTGLGGLQWVVDAYTIPLAATVLTAGALADRFGRRRLFMLGLATFTASSALQPPPVEGRAAVEAARFLRREQEELRFGVVRHVAAIRLPAQPFAHPALLETRARRELMRRQRAAEDERAKQVEPGQRHEEGLRHGGIVTVPRQATAKKP